jgi:hypothetical protein
LNFELLPTLQFYVTVYDGQLYSAATQITVHVNNSNDAPECASGALTLEVDELSTGPLQLVGGATVGTFVFADEVCPR